MLMLIEIDVTSAQELKLRTLTMTLTWLNMDNILFLLTSTGDKQRIVMNGNHLQHTLDSTSDVVEDLETITPMLDTKEQIDIINSTCFM